MPSKIPGEHPGGVLYRLAAADLQIAGGEEQRLPAQLVHADLKGNPGTGGGFLKDHAQSLALQMVVGDAVLLLVFQLVGQV